MLFVTGTDTSVGKTYFTSNLVKYLKTLDKDVIAYKPVETGCDPECEDAKILSEASGVNLEPVYKFKEPLAPAVAGEVEKVKIVKELIVKSCRDLMKKKKVIFEGAGGIHVPITWNYTFLDLIKELSLPVIIIALNKLGVLNHTLLTVEACLRERIEVRGVILNTKEKEDKSVVYNYYSLQKLLTVPVFRFPQESIEKIAFGLKLF